MRTMRILAIAIGLLNTVTSGADSAAARISATGNAGTWMDAPAIGFAANPSKTVAQLDLSSAQAPAIAPAASGASVRAYLQSLVPFGFSGNAVVSVAGKVVLLAAYGSADRERGLPMRPDTVISVGSITKQFTAAAILRLAEMGKLDVHGSIASYLPDVPPDKRAITLHELLTHSAGLQANYGGDFEPLGRDAFVARVMAAPLATAPGTKFAYSNAGYSLLAAIVERVSGMAYERFLHDELFVPAGMLETGYTLPHWAPSRIAVGYTVDGNRWGTLQEHGWGPDGPYWNLLGNGGILSTPMDMYRWSEALARHRVLSARSVNALQTGYVDEGDPESGRYGYGWDVVQTPHGKLVSHNGGNGIFAAQYMRYVDGDTTIYVASNAAAIPAARLARGLGAAAFGDPHPPAPTQEIASLPVAPRLTGDTATLAMLSGSALPVVEMLVNGKGPYRFAIETSVPLIAIRDRVVQDLHLTPAVTGQSPLYRLESITAPGLNYANVSAVEIPIRSSSIDGVLGINAFDGVLLTLDYPKGQVTLGRGTLPRPDGKTILPAVRIAFGFGVHVSLAGYATDALLDTRSAPALSLPNVVAKQVSLVPPGVASARLAGDLTFGAFSVIHPMASVTELPPYLPDVALLGSDLLAHFTMTLDERSERVRFELPGGSTVVTEPSR